MVEESGVFIQVKYKVEASDSNSTVVTEGYWTFQDKSHVIQQQMTEKDVIYWIKKESIIDESCIIESNLQKQIDSFYQQNIAQKPWIKPTYKVQI